MILSAIQTDHGALLRIDAGQGIEATEHTTIEAARAALLQREREIRRLHPGVTVSTQWQGSDLTVVIQGLPDPEPEPEPVRPRKAVWHPDPYENPKAFRRWRLGVIRRASERLAEEMAEVELEELEIG